MVIATAKLMVIAAAKKEGSLNFSDRGFVGENLAAGKCDVASASGGVRAHPQRSAASSARNPHQKLGRDYQAGWGV